MSDRRRRDLFRSLWRSTARNTGFHAEGIWLAEMELAANRHGQGDPGLLTGDDYAYLWERLMTSRLGFVS